MNKNSMQEQDNLLKHNEVIKELQTEQTEEFDLKKYYMDQYKTVEKDYTEKQIDDYKRRRLEDIKKSYSLIKPTRSLLTTQPMRETWYTHLAARKKSYKEAERAELTERAERMSLLEEQEREADREIERKIEVLRGTELGAQIITPEFLPIVKSVAGILGNDIDSDLAFLMAMKNADNQRNAAVAEKMKEFINIDLTGFDFSTDEKFIESGSRLAALEKTVQAVAYLPKEEQENMAMLGKGDYYIFKKKLDLAQDIIKYYRMKKIVMSDPYYLTHFNSEMKFVFSMKDSLDARAFKLKLWMLESATARLSTDGSDPFNEVYAIMDYRLETDETPEMTEEIRDAFARRVGVALELGKNGAINVDGNEELYKYYDQLLKENGPIVKRLTGRDYTVTGMEIKSRDNITRQLGGLFGLTAVKNMDVAQVKDMIEKLTASAPKDASAEEIERAKQLNLEGMRIYKGVLGKHAQYLKRKYGSGLALITPEERIRHFDEFKSDFSDMQALTEFMAYCRRIPDMFTEEDRETELLLTYYHGINISESPVRAQFITKGLNYTNYIKETAVQFAAMDENIESFREIEKMNLHREVRWNEQFDSTQRPPTLMEKYHATIGKAQTIEQQERDKKNIINGAANLRKNAFRLSGMDKRYNVGDFVNEEKISLFKNSLDYMKKAEFVTKPFLKIIAVVEGFLEQTDYDKQQVALTKAIQTVQKYVDDNRDVVDTDGRELLEYARDIRDYLVINANGSLCDFNHDDEVLYDNPPCMELVSWKDVSEYSLFPHEPSVNDVKQRLARDTFMMSSLAAIAYRNPSKIRKAMRDNEDGTVTVRFFEEDARTKTMKPVFVTVKKEIATFRGVAEVYAADSLWVQMIEKAYAAMFGGVDGYDGMTGDNGNIFLKRFLGENYAPKEDMSIDPGTFYAEAEKRLGAGEVITAVCNKTDNAEIERLDKTGLKVGHEYAVLEVGTTDEQVKYVRLRDPYARFTRGYDRRTGEAVNTSSGLYAGETMGMFDMRLDDFLATFTHFTGLLKHE